MGIETTEVLKVLHRPQREEDAWLPEGLRIVRLGDRTRLGWVNIQTGANAATGSIHLLDATTCEHRRIDLDDRPGFFVDLGDGTAIVGTGKRLRQLNWITEELTTVAGIDDSSPHTIINDGEPTPDGRAIVFGTKDTRFQEPIGCLYLYTCADHRLTRLADGMTCSNGKVLQSRVDGLYALYDIDTPRKVVDRYELNIETRSLTHRGIAVDLRHRADFPDGMCAAWGDDLAAIAFYHPGEVSEGRAELFDLKTGKSLLRWLTPGSPRVTCPLLVPHPGGLNELIVATAVEGMPQELRQHSPNAGCIFVSRVQ